MTLLEHALMFAAEGLPVIPLRGKWPAIPTTEGGQGFKDASSDPDRVRAMFARPNVTGIGLATGARSGVFVLDVDPRSKGDITLAGLERAHGPLPETLRVESGRGDGGQHIYFNLPPVGDREWAKTIGAGLDIKTDGGYVVVPPSPHPEGKRQRYAWANLCDIAEAPPWVLDRALRKPAPPVEPKPREPGTFGAQIDEACVRWVADHPRSYPPKPSECPVCHDTGSFKVTPQSPDRWYCFSTDHPDHVGIKGTLGYHGDALDLEAFARGKTPIEVLIEDGYLRPKPARVEPPPHSDEEMPPPRSRRVPGEDDETTPPPAADSPRNKTPRAFPLTAVDRLWRPCPIEALEAVPAPRRYLLRHPDADGRACPDGHGDGLLPLGKTGLLASAGGVGKTFVLVALAVAVITGRRWLGWFHVDRLAHGRRVLLALAEEDREEAERRLYDTAQAYELTHDERALVAERLVLLPLHGEQVPLVAFGPDGRTLIDSAELHALRERLHSGAGAEEWSLVSVDPMIRFAGCDAETNNEIATAFVQRLETLSRAPGHPTVLAAHHTNQVSREEGGAKPRGVTALNDAFRWVATVRRIDRWRCGVPPDQIELFAPHAGRAGPCLRAALRPAPRTHGE